MKKNELVWGIKALPILVKDWILINLWHPKEEYSEIRKLKNIHKGERCFFIGTGPSLRVEDVQKLKNERVFICNYGIALCKELSFKPDYYLIVDSSCYEDIKDYIDTNLVKTPIVIDMLDFKGGIESLKDNREWLHLPGYRAFFYVERLLKQRWSFSKDVARAVFSGGSVVYFCYQLAAYMGFSEINLLGMDCDYGKDELHFISVNRETDRRLKKNFIWYNNNFVKMHQCAAHYCKKRGIYVFNLTRGGNLEIFERKNLEEVL